MTSLFTNIPLQETIDIAINLILNHNTNLNITIKELNIFMGFYKSKWSNECNLNKPKFYLRYN